MIPVPFRYTDGDGCRQTVVILGDYELDNLRCYLLMAAGNSFFKPVKPFDEAHNGDWLWQILHMLDGNAAFLKADQAFDCNFREFRGRVEELPGPVNFR